MLSERTMLSAVVFDFDGLILDTETPLFEAWRDVFQMFGAEPISLELWVESLGLPSDHPRHIDRYAVLEERIGRSLSGPDVERIRGRMQDQRLDERDVRPGVVELLDQADRRGLGVALASSSPFDWIERHLEPRGLLDRFHFHSCAGDGVPGKPDPAVYLRACAELGVEPSRAVALEDSPHGVTAANTAGLLSVACPNPISATLDFSHADHVIGSLTEVALAD